MSRPPIHSPSTPPNVVLYHAECLDGFGAAWAMWKRFPSAKFIAVKHGAPPPTGLSGRRIVIVDFSYSREILERLAKEAASIQVLDHHVTAERALAGLSYAYFNQKKSGAVLAWEWAHDEPVPWLLQYVQDKDLWTWTLPNSREINAALMSYPFDFRVWDDFQQSRLEEEGRAILRYEKETVDKLITRPTMVSFEGATVPAVQSAVLNSQIGERLSPHFPFCIIWYDQDGRRYFSLRSRENGGTDVAAIATKYGGGGHTHAAGFSVSLNSTGPSPLDLLMRRSSPRTARHEAHGERRPRRRASDRQG